jgi:hypothetical protein
MIVFYGKNTKVRTPYFYVDFIYTADTQDDGDILEGFDISWWAVPGTLNND